MRDGDDVVKSVGYLTLYGAYLEEQIELLLYSIESLSPYKGGFQISSKIDHARKFFERQTKNDFRSIISDLKLCKEIFEDRNVIVHGRVYAKSGCLDILKSSRPKVEEREISSAEINILVNEMERFKNSIQSYTCFRLPEVWNMLD
ncbi:hypothetical protein [Gilvimarinus polysaccharolyticus]|uniref:hypothetical protein n=1 Tax=Gilvimarinus polysaccharolyticus TaxID=863921 RepID=UPI0006731D31|nr:hypothetical protein [Gilvimarinus polysaccharolyticus]